MVSRSSAKIQRASVLTLSESLLTALPRRRTKRSEVGGPPHFGWQQQKAFRHLRLTIFSARRVVWRAKRDCSQVTIKRNRSGKKPNLNLQIVGCAKRLHLKRSVL